MSRIFTNVNAMTARRVHGTQSNTLNTSMERLSTGLRINRGKDDPAGLIASENLRSEKAAISSAIGNAQRADQVVNVAEGGLQEINSSLVELQSLVTASSNEAGLSKEEKEANQQQVEAILQTIDRVASNTSFQGAKLLNGQFDFQVDKQHSNVQSYQINAATVGDKGLNVKALVTQSAQHAGVFMELSAATLNTSGSDDLFTVEVGGAMGSHQFSFSSSTKLEDVAAQVNNFTDRTGVTAKVSGTGLVMKSNDYGSDQFVSVNVVDDAGQSGAIYGLSKTDENKADTSAKTELKAATTAIRDEGQDVEGTINGISARGKGTTLDVKSGSLDMSVTLAASETATEANALKAGELDLLKITGGGAKFNIGPSVDASNQVTLGIASTSASKLGTQSFGTKTFRLSDLSGAGDLNLIDGNLEQAQDVVNAAIKEVSGLRGRLGSFQKNVIGANVNSLNVTYENISAAESTIRDADFAQETSNMTRAQILQQSSSQVLSMAKSAPQSVLSLLG